MKQMDLHSVFGRRYEEKLLQLLGLELEKGKNSWLKRLFRGTAQIQYPIRHLIVMNFLGFTAADFFDRLRDGGPFGAGPWPCLNPVSACRNNLLILECTVRPQLGGPPNSCKPVGDFECPQCGFIGSVATLQEWSDMLDQCSLRHRFPVSRMRKQSNPKSSFWQLVGICVFPCRTGTSRNCSPSEACEPITSRCGVGSSGMPQRWNDVCALGSDRPTTVGAWTKPTSGSRASGSIYTGVWRFQRCDDRLPSVG